jgi:hypothetical protein
MLAVKYGSAAMKQTNPSRGKEFGGGSVILTASVAGIRSGAGPLDCMCHLLSYRVILTYINVVVFQIVQARQREYLSYYEPTQISYLFI